MQMFLNHYLAILSAPFLLLSRLSLPRGPAPVLSQDPWIEYPHPIELFGGQFDHLVADSDTRLCESVEASGHQ
jgi:hypothetical protein